MWKIAKVEPLWHFSALDHRDFDITSGIYDAIDDVARHLEHCTEQTTITRFWKRPANIFGKIHLHHIHTSNIDMREYADVGDCWYIDLCSGDHLFERESNGQYAAYKERVAAKQVGLVSGIMSRSCWLFPEGRQSSRHFSR